MGDIVRLRCISFLDIPPDVILEEAMGQLDGVVLIGWTKPDEHGDRHEFFASSVADGPDALWLVERFKKRLLDLEGAE